MARSYILIVNHNGMSLGRETLKIRIIMLFRTFNHNIIITKIFNKSLIIVVERSYENNNNLLTKDT